MNDNLIRDLLGEDELGVVIRSHIHIEEYVDKFLALKADNYKYLLKIKLEFSEKILLALSLGLDEDFQKPLIVISKIRNKFAHKTDSALTDSDVNNLYKSFCSREKSELQDMIKNNPDGPDSLAKEYSKLSTMEKLVIMILYMSSKFEMVINEAVNELNMIIRLIDAETNA
jgi:hypothetical protein